MGTKTDSESFPLSCFIFLLVNLLPLLSLFDFLRVPSAFGLLAADTEFQMRISPPQLTDWTVPFPSLEPVDFAPLFTGQCKVLIISYQDQQSPLLTSPHLAFRIFAFSIRPHIRSPLDRKHLPAGQGLAHLCILTSSKRPRTE